MKYLISYSNRYDAKKNGWPPECSTVEINTLEDLHNLIEQFKEKVILFEKGYIPTQYDPQWGGCYYDEEDYEDYHITHLPEGWESMPWLEIYNSWRE